MKIYDSATLPIHPNFPSLPATRLTVREWLTTRDCPEGAMQAWLDQPLAQAVTEKRFLGRCLELGLLDPWLTRSLLEVGPALGALAGACACHEAWPQPVPAEQELMHSLGGRTFVVFYAMPHDPGDDEEAEAASWVEWDAAVVSASDRETAGSMVRRALDGRELRPVLVLTRAQCGWFDFLAAAVDLGVVPPTAEADL